ncbi:hypothetical protein [Actinokineospora bangkokensis]|uniref:Uncharacterized protein n=1 Tax=Actinokineospora bangkokensis TaxID=1193682 RepID=A0A1Q9LJH5_9PSEU|nr:hypothetical protein [Actinokineospora bangkokensis]OLR92129.1 hypothetical protein BJP25_22570 [Actinokineospora bangkokensis]
MSVWQLAEALRAASATLTGAQALLTGGAALPLEQARAGLLAVRREGDDFHPAELDLALAELTRAAELVALARETIDDYATRL